MYTKENIAFSQFSLQIRVFLSKIKFLLAQNKIVQFLPKIAQSLKFVSPKYIYIYAWKNTDHQFKEGHFKEAVPSHEQVPSQTKAAFDELLASKFI